MPPKHSSVPRYKIVAIRDPRPWLKFFPSAISPNGRFVAGNTMRRFGDDREWRVILWNNGRFIDVSEERYIMPTAVNDAGVIVGRVPASYERPRYAVVCCPATGENGRYIVEPLFTEHVDNYALAIDNAGNIYGGKRDGDENTPSRAFLRRPDGTTIFLDARADYSSYVITANENHQVLVSLESRAAPRFNLLSGIWNAAHATASSGDALRELKPLAPGQCYEPRAINNHGDVVGYAETNAGAKLPVIWRSGEREPSPLLGAEEGRALGINDHGDIIGQVGPEDGAPFLIHRGRFYLLNDLVDRATPIVFPRQILSDGSVFAAVLVKNRDRFQFLLPSYFRMPLMHQTVLFQPLQK